MHLLSSKREFPENIHSTILYLTRLRVGNCNQPSNDYNSITAMATAQCVYLYTPNRKKFMWAQNANNTASLSRVVCTGTKIPMFWREQRFLCLCEWVFLLITSCCCSTQTGWCCTISPWWAVVLGVEKGRERKRRADAFPLDTHCLRVLLICHASVHFEVCACNWCTCIHTHQYTHIDTRAHTTGIVKFYCWW